MMAKLHLSETLKSNFVFLIGDSKEEKDGSLGEEGLELFELEYGIVAFESNSELEELSSST